MEVIKKYSYIKGTYLTEGEKHFEKNLKRWVLLISPVYIVSIMILYGVFYFINLENEDLNTFYNVLIGIFKTVTIQSILSLVIKRLKIMNKTNWNKISVEIKEIPRYKGEVDKFSGQYYLSRLLDVTIGAILSFLFLGGILYYLIKIKTGDNVSIGTFIGGRYGELTWIIIISSILLVLNIVHSMRRYIFQKTVELILKDIEEGNIDIAKENIKKYLKNRNLWGAEYTILFRQIISMIDKLEKKQRETNDKTIERIELITNASHDIKTPLTSIISYSKILQDENLTKEEREEYEIILKNKCNRLSKLMRELNATVESDERLLELYIQNQDILKLIEGFINNNAEKFKDKNLKIQIKKLSDSCVHNIDLIKTERVLQNILENIYKYSKPGSIVDITIEEEKEVCTLSFKNESENEILESAENLLKRFTRGDKARNTEGYGLGLNIAKRFMELQGGSLKIVVNKYEFQTILIFK